MQAGKASLSGKEGVAEIGKAPPLRFFSLLIASLALASADTGNLTAEGGNITSVNISGTAPSIWHAACGNLSSASGTAPAINATPNSITYAVLRTGSSSCANGTRSLTLLFSNSSSQITSLSAGSLAALDDFVSSENENGTATFTQNTTFETGSYGNISSVPTTYIEPAASQDFRLGYLQDQSGNLVFIAPPASQKPGFDGSLMDFEAMLPTRGGADTPYYVKIDLACNPYNPPPTPPSPGGGGGGGGGGTGGGAASSAAGYSAWPPADLYVDVGEFCTPCQVNARREIVSSANRTMVTTTLRNLGDEHCTLSDFVVVDSIPAQFARLEETAVAPEPFYSENSTVIFIFPTFAPNESRVITYTVKRDIPVSRLSNFTVMRVAAKKSSSCLRACEVGGGFSIKCEGGTARPAGPCSPEVYCAQWGPCVDGYSTQRCKDISGCTTLDLFRVDKCTPPSAALQSGERTICSAIPFLCASEPEDRARAFVIAVSFFLFLEAAALVWRFFLPALAERRRRESRAQAHAAQRRPRRRRRLPPPSPPPRLQVSRFRNY